MSEQQQFLQVLDRDEAERRFREAIAWRPLGEVRVPLAESLGRVLARDVIAEVDVPSFDRSNFDGYALQAADTFGATEDKPRQLQLMHSPVSTGSVPVTEVVAGTAVGIATGGMLPRGADAVVLVEHTDIERVRDRIAEGDDAQAITDGLFVRRAVTPGHGVTFAGTDIAAGETVLREGELLTSRETGVLAAIGTSEVCVYRRPRVAIFSTGNEIIPPGESMQPGKVYDSNLRILADAVREQGGEPLEYGIVADNRESLAALLDEALEVADMVLLSGGTSKGEGDLCYRVVAERTRGGIVAHGVALKPGKPICLAAHHGRPIVILPGFPTSAIFTFHEFVAPVIRHLGGLKPELRASIPAKLAVKVNSEIGRTEYLLVGLIENQVPPGGAPSASAVSPNAPQSAARRAVTHPPAQVPGHLAFPMGKGSGSVTTFSRADGFISIDRHTEIVDSGTDVEVTLLGRDVRPADLIVIGSHCVGLDYLLGALQRSGWSTKFLAVGSTAGLAAARRGECDLAGIHLLDPATGQYNRPYVDERLVLIDGYRRRQGILFRAGDKRFSGCSAQEVVAAVRRDPQCVMINRNQGSGTRILIDELLAESPGSPVPRGYAICARNHNAVAAAIRQGRADWGVAIETVLFASNRSAAVNSTPLDFLPLKDEHYDFVIPKGRRERPAVGAFCDLLQQASIQKRLVEFGFALGPTRASGP